MANTEISATRGSFLRLSRLRPPYALITLALLILLWEIGVRAANVPSYLLPAPTAIVAVLEQQMNLFAYHAGVTLFEIVAGFCIAVLIGVPIATLIAYSDMMDKAIYPLIVGSQTIPKVAIAPILLAVFGYGISPKIAIVTLMSFFPVVVNSVVGFRSAPPEMLHLASSMGASPLQVFWRFRLPQALPSIFAGLKLASVLAVVGAVVAEFVGARAGLGYIIMMAGSNFRMDQQFAAIVLLSAMGMILFWIINLIEARVLPWHVSVRGHRGD